MIALVVGAPGSGKSYTSVALIAEALRVGKPVATNVELSDDWADRVVDSIPLARLRGRRWRAARARELARLLFVSADLAELFRVRLAPCRKCAGCKRGASCRTEGRGLMVLDEAHNWMNARTWDSDGVSDSKKEAVQRRLKVVRFFSQHRKLGWEVHLITQDENNIDRQVRTLFEAIVRLRNLRNFKVAGIPVIPVRLFLAIWVWNDPSKSVLKRQVRRLNKRVAGMYDSMATSHGLEDDVEGAPIWLPAPPAHWSAPAAGAPEAAAAAPVPSVPDPDGGSEGISGPRTGLTISAGPVRSPEKLSGRTAPLAPARRPPVVPSAAPGHHRSPTS